LLQDYGTILQIHNNLGQVVAEMDLPDGWHRGKIPSRPSYLLASKFYISDRDQRIGITLREPPKKTYHFVEPQQNEFLSLLRRPAHEVGEQALLNISLLLEQVSWPAKFKRDWARTTYFPPHNVLQIQGTWVQERLKSRGLILDTTFDSDNYVQEVWFLAPAEIFDIYAAECERIFSSFRWNVDVEELTSNPWASS